MSLKHTGQTVPEITQEEHDFKNVAAKKSSLFGYDPNTDQLVRLTAIDNGDGTYSLKTAGAASTGGATADNQTNGNQLVVDANKRSVLTYAQILTSSTTLTPTSGKRLKLVKVQVLQNPDNTTANPVATSFASIGTFNNGWAYSDSSEVTGLVNEALDITLGTAQPVSVNIRYKEL